MPDTINHTDLLSMTADIVSAHVSNNTVSKAELPGLIETVYKALGNLSGVAMMSGDQPQPAVPVKKSVHPDYIICLEDGKKLKMLKRHLKSAYNMTPEEYREKWHLPLDYPMVAPNYAQKRSELAKNSGLGTSPNSGLKKKK